VLRFTGQRQPTAPDSFPGFDGHHVVVVIDSADDGQGIHQKSTVDHLVESANVDDETSKSNASRFVFKWQQQHDGLGRCSRTTTVESRGRHPDPQEASPERRRRYRWKYPGTGDGERRVVGWYNHQ
jgi:hypothetical protein